MQIWEERTIGKDGKKESKRSFEKLQLYLTEIPKPRNLYDLATLILYDEKNSKKVKRNQEIEKTYNSLYKLYSNYNWEGRSNAYDNYWTSKKQEAKNQLALDIELENIPLLRQRLTATNVDYQKLMENDTEKVVVNNELIERKVRPKDDAEAKLNNINAYKTTAETLYLFLNGGKVKSENVNKNTHTINKEGIDYFAGKDEYDKDKDFNIDDFINDD